MVLRTELDAGGFIDRLNVATSPNGSDGQTLVVVQMCPGHEGVPDQEGLLQCPGEAAVKRFGYEFDSKGKLARQPVELSEWIRGWPQPLAGGFLLFGGTLQANLAAPQLTGIIPERAIYRDGQVTRIESEDWVNVGSSGNECTTEKDLWVLHVGHTGLRKLWRLSLSDEAKEGFTEVAMPGLEDGSAPLRLACGDDEAFVFEIGPSEKGGELYSTKDPKTPIRPPAGTINGLLDHTGGLPNVWIGNTDGSPCGVITEDGRIRRKRVPRTKDSSCDAGVWRIGNRLVAVTQRPQNAGYPRVSKVTVGPW